MEELNDLNILDIQYSSKYKKDEDNIKLKDLIKEEII